MTVKIAECNSKYLLLSSPYSGQLYSNRQSSMALIFNFWRPCVTIRSWNRAWLLIFSFPFPIQFPWISCMEYWNFWKGNIQKNVVCYLNWRHPRIRNNKIWCTHLVHLRDFSHILIIMYFKLDQKKSSKKIFSVFHMGWAEATINLEK